MSLQKLDESQSIISPEVFGQSLEWAQQKAKKLKAIVDSQQLSVKIGPSEHLKVEGWQTIGRGYGYTCRTTVDELVKDSDGRMVGVKATASILDGLGAIVGGADSFCFRDEEKYDKDTGEISYPHGKQTIAQWAGMAQTRAEARAFKQVLSWVVILAGYNPTPAEEMTGSVAHSLETNVMLLCPIHDKEWFKKGKMRAYAHPVEGVQGPKGGTVWCNMNSDNGDGVMDSIDQMVKAEVTRLGWDKEQIVTAIQSWFGTDWRQLTPAQKKEAVKLISEQHPDVDPSTGEIIES